MQEERQKHASDAEKMKRKQAKIHEEAVKKQEDAEKVGARGTFTNGPLPFFSRNARLSGRGTNFPLLRHSGAWGLEEGRWVGREGVTRAQHEGGGCVWVCISGMKAFHPWFAVLCWTSQSVDDQMTHGAHTYPHVARSARPADGRGLDSMRSPLCTTCLPRAHLPDPPLRSSAHLLPLPPCGTEPLHARGPCPIAGIAHNSKPSRVPPLLPATAPLSLRPGRAWPTGSLTLSWPVLTHPAPSCPILARPDPS